MRIAIFGGSFNPPHKGHLHSAVAAAKQIQPDQFLVIPDNLPPHKELAAGSPTTQQRIELCRLNFAGVPKSEVSDMEIVRGGRSYTADTIRDLRAKYPDAELYLLMGTDMFLTLDQWREPDYILGNCVIAPFQRSAEELDDIERKRAALQEKYGAKVEIVAAPPHPAASTQVREQLQRRSGRELLTDAVYGYIVKHRLYGVRVDFTWLRLKGEAMLKPKRVPHVRGCEEEAVRLAKRWGADPEQAAEAAILHDCTKRLPLPEQLNLCRKYGIVPDTLEGGSEKLLHAKTGAAIAEQEFGAAPEVAEAIRWHTTGRAGMSLLEKIVYMADYIEPNRSFPGVEELRRLAYEDLDGAMRLGFEMSIEDVRSYGNTVHQDTLAALEYFQKKEANT